MLLAFSCPTAQQWWQLVGTNHANIVRRELEIFDTIAVGVCMSFVFRLFSTRWQRISRIYACTYIGALPCPTKCTLIARRCCAVLLLLRCTARKNCAMFDVFFLRWVSGLGARADLSLTSVTFSPPTSSGCIPRVHLRFLAPLCVPKAGGESCA